MAEWNVQQRARLRMKERYGKQNSSEIWSSRSKEFMGLYLVCPIYAFLQTTCFSNQHLFYNLFTCFTTQVHCTSIPPSRIDIQIQSLNTSSFEKKLRYNIDSYMLQILTVYYSIITLHTKVSTCINKEVSIQLHSHLGNLFTLTNDGDDGRAICMDHEVFSSFVWIHSSFSFFVFNSKGNLKHHKNCNFFKLFLKVIWFENLLSLNF